MATKIKHKLSKTSPAKKNIRLARAIDRPLTHLLEVTGQVPNGRKKTFRFSVVTPTAQKKERNNAYRYFSFD